MLHQVAATAAVAVAVKASLACNNATLTFRSANLLSAHLKRGYALNIRRNLKRAAVGGGDEPQRHDERQG